MNNFEKLAEMQMVAATKAKHRRREAKVVQSEKEAPMKLSAQEQAQVDGSTQFRAYRRWKKAERLIVFEKRPAEWAVLSQLLKNLSIHNPETLLDYVNNSPWLLNADISTRRIVLSLLDDEIVRVRMENGLPPIDDSIFDEEPTLFEIIRKRLKVL